jgi:hypothetical protein
MPRKLNVVHRFDPVSKRHYLNQWNAVLHCHHYSTLFTDLAVCTRSFGGIEKLVEAGDKVFGMLLKDYFAKEGVSTLDDKVAIAEQYWRVMGMGMIKIFTSDKTSGTATMEYSHLDEGWLKKFGHWNSPVNFFTQGFLAGFFGAAYGLPFGSYEVAETQSLVRGDDISRFDIKLKTGGS